MNVNVTSGQDILNRTVELDFMDYINHFKQIWHRHFPSLSVDFEVFQIEDGITEVFINVSHSTNNHANKSNASFLVQYAYNRLDFQEGVSFFAVNVKTGQKTCLLPQHKGSGNDTYGYSTSEIERLIQDIKELRVLDL